MSQKEERDLVRSNALRAQEMAAASMPELRGLVSTGTQSRDGGRPFDVGSISLGLYIHDLSPSKALDELFEQAALAWQAGFHGVTLAEHHAGFPSYLPTPLQVVGWLLDEFAGWAATFPLLVPLRPIELWIEELAWLVARFPHRIGLGVAPGYIEDDFSAVAAQFNGRFQRYWHSIEVLMQTLAGTPPGALERDPAVTALKETPPPVVAAATGSRSITNAARLGLGIAPPGYDDEHILRVLSEYRSAGGRGPRVINRWPWIGDPPEDDRRRRLAMAGDHSWRSADVGKIVHAATPAQVAERLNESISRTSATGLSLRLHHGDATSPAAVRDMIRAFAEVIPLLRFKPLTQ